MNKTLLSMLVAGTFLSGCAAQFNTAEISKESLYNDVAYLASDDLQGRKAYTPEIDQAADFIASRFNEIGLEPMAGLNSFKQQFSLYQIVPANAAASLNGKNIDNSKVMVISNQSNLRWTSTSNVNVTHISAEDNFRQKVQVANMAGGDHLFLVDPKHEQMFGRYKAYFARGATKSSLENTGNMALVLTSESNAKRFEITASNQTTEHTLTNVVGVLPGKSKTKESVIFSAHYDHLGTQGGEVFNGADDDASGTGAVINLAQYYKDLANNERSLMFVAFTAEEMGLLGSSSFSNLLNPDDVTAMINLEMIGKPSKFGPGRIWMTGADKSNLIDLLNANLDVENHIQPNPYTTQNLFYRSDNATLAKLGVPAHSFSTVQMDTDKHYHKSTDDISTLDFDSMHQVVKNIANAATPLVSGEITPSRVAPLPSRPKGKIY